MWESQKPPAPARVGPRESSGLTRARIPPRSRPLFRAQEPRPGESESPRPEPTPSTNRNLNLAAFSSNLSLPHHIFFERIPFSWERTSIAKECALKSCALSSGISGTRSATGPSLQHLPACPGLSSAIGLCVAGPASFVTHCQTSGTVVLAMTSPVRNLERCHHWSRSQPGTMYGLPLEPTHE